MRLIALLLAVCGLIYVAATNIEQAAGLYEHGYDLFRGPETHVIQLDLGGNLQDYLENYAAARRHGDKYKIDGLCVSGCTLITGEIPEKNVCVTPFAKLGFHAAYRFGLKGERIFAAEGTDLLWHAYSPKVRDLLIKHGWKGPETDQPTLIWIEGDELQTIFRACDE